jgi:hypothetical protein
MGLFGVKLLVESNWGVLLRFSSNRAFSTLNRIAPSSRQGGGNTVSRLMQLVQRLATPGFVSVV